ncbi:PREDICTED: aldehyde dehydrogenase family 16 member A1-like [Acropora digitifera]|uniref:aldehyde dehydrogenase family 16 member A1-like n=1 Tax=Acropora digitifera TaxID=70779 RepID=UPI00077A6489|nr:PREDICTED: aldehyde dehydrogenase family 16 member A1-like [Acropora digitifera]
MASVHTETETSMAEKSVGPAKIKKNPAIAQIFESLEYGPAPEAANSVNSWLQEHGRDFGHFVNGKWLKPKGRKIYESRNPATGETLASTLQGEQEDIDNAVSAAREAFKSWSKLPGHIRARYLYSIARHVQKHARLIAVLESMDNGKPIRETRDADVQIVVRHLYHHAGWAQLMDTEMRDWKPVGVVGAIVPWNFPLMLLCWKVCPALAMGNTVVLKPATYTRLTALLFAEICAEAGLPPGVFNVVTGNGAFGSSLAAHPDVDKVAFTGSTEVLFHSFKVFGPVLTVLPFRTAKEGIALANNTNYGLAGSVWTENLSLALEVAMSIKAGSVWVNGHNLFDAAAGFGGYRESGFGRDGGKEGLYEYVCPSWQARPRPSVKDYDVKTFGSSVPAVVRNPSASPVKAPDCKSGETGGVKPPSIDRTYKVYTGGNQKRPDGNYSRPVLNPSGEVIGQVAEGNRKDIRDAVEAAHKAAPGWGKRAAHNRAQIVYYMAENLELRHSEFSERLCNMTGCSIQEANKEVDMTIQRLFYWGAYADKYGGTVQETPFYGATVKIHEPVGVIGIACPDRCPLVAFISLLAPAVIRGNTVVIIPSQSHPMVAVDMYQVFDTSDLPGGVVNIITGDRDHLTKYLTEHQDVQAMWYFGSAEGSKFVEWSSAVNVKRTFVNYGQSRDWFDNAQGHGEEFLFHSTECKNIWLPMGDIFAN